jgi:hypothetical protein
MGRFNGCAKTHRQKRTAFCRWGSPPARMDFFAGEMEEQKELKRAAQYEPFSGDKWRLFLLKVCTNGNRWNNKGAALGSAK